MHRVLECLNAQHREIEKALESVARLAASDQHENCLRAFAAIEARIARQLDMEEELLAILYGPAAGAVGDALRDEHRQVRMLVATCRQRLEVDDVVQFADDAQMLMFKFTLHAHHEERALAVASASPEHASAVGLFVERMAPKR